MVTKLTIKPGRVTITTDFPVMKNPAITRPASVKTTIVVPTTNGTLDFVANPVISGLDSSLVQGYALFSSFLNGANLAQTEQQAQTDDSSVLFESAYNVIFPLIPDNSTIGIAFQDFSDFVDQTRGVPEC